LWLFVGIVKYFLSFSILIVESFPFHYQIMLSPFFSFCKGLIPHTLFSLLFLLDFFDLFLHQ